MPELPIGPSVAPSKPMRPACSWCWRWSWLPGAQAQVKGAAGGVAVAGGQAGGEECRIIEDLGAQGVDPAAAEGGVIVKGACVGGVVGVGDGESVEAPQVGIGRVAANAEVGGLVVGLHGTRQQGDQAGGIVKGGGSRRTSSMVKAWARGLTCR